MNSKTMKAVVADELGPLENYSLRDVPLQEPGPGQARVRIIAASLGYADALVARGGYQVLPPTPFIPGSEFSGVIDALGTGVSTYSLGQKVCGLTMSGALAEQVVVDIPSLAPLPDGLSFEAGASFLVNFQTSYYALVQRGELKPGETLLVLGAAGGVGLAAVQIGRALGAKVIAGASSAAKRRFALEQGAEDVLDYSRPEWREELKKITGGRGVDLVYDPIGGDLFEPAFRSLAWKGRYLVIGFVGGAIPKLATNLALLKGASLVGVDIRQFTIKEPEVAAANAQVLWRWLAEKKLNPPVGPVYPLALFREALQRASEGSAMGKVVLTIATDIG